jgi:tetratricopeptide (TPR) repeat protein
LCAIKEKSGDFQAALGDCDASIKMAPTPMAYRNRCAVKGGLKDLSGAIADCNEAIRLFPGFGPAHFVLAGIQELAGDKSAALTHYDKAIEIDPKSQAAWLNRCALKYALDDQAGAIDDCKKSVEIDPRSDYAAISFRNLGIMHGEIDMGAACDYLKEGASLGEDQADELFKDFF